MLSTQVTPKCKNVVAVLGDVLGDALGDVLGITFFKSHGSTFLL